MWSAFDQVENIRPLSWEEQLFMVEMEADLEIVIQANIPAVESPVLGSMGPYQNGNTVRLPMFVADILIEDMLAFPRAPPWLHPSQLDVLIRAETASVDLKPPPNTYYYEIGTKLLVWKHNPFWEYEHPLKTRDNAIHLFDMFVNLRRRKIRTLNDKAIADTFVMTTNLSAWERRLISTELMSFSRQATDPGFNICAASVDSILREHFNLQSALDEHSKWTEKAKLHSLRESRCSNL